MGESGEQLMTQRTGAERVHRQGQLATIAASLCWSTAGALQRELTVDTVTQMAGRAGVAAVVLTVFTWYQNRGRTLTAFASVGVPGLLFAAAMAGASGCFVFALNRTTVANVIFLQALSPLMAVLLAWVLLREKASARTWLAMGIAAIGVGVMVGSPGGGPLSGFLASTAMALLFAVTIVIARHHRTVSMLPAVTLGQFMLFAVAAPLSDFGSITGRDAVAMGAMGLFQMGLGQAFFVIGARLIPSAEVALITLLEVVLAPVWVWVFHSESPGTPTLIGGAVVLAAVVVQATESPDEVVEAESVEHGLAPSG